MRLYRIATGISILAVAASAQQKPAIVGGVSSTAPIEIDGTSMDPAPSWPLVDGDVIRTTSAPGLILTPDQSAITMTPGTTVRVRALPAGQVWVFMREGALAIDTKNRNVLICAANRLFQPSGPAKGSIQLQKSGTVSETTTAGTLAELKGGCNEQSGPVAGGTATAPAANNRATIAAALAAALAGAIPAGFAAASNAPACVSSGCNFNPPPVSPSGP